MTIRRWRKDKTGSTINGIIVATDYVNLGITIGESWVQLSTEREITVVFNTLTKK